MVGYLDAPRSSRAKSGLLCAYPEAIKRRSQTGSSDGVPSITYPHATTAYGAEAVGGRTVERLRDEALTHTLGLAACIRNSVFLISSSGSAKCEGCCLWRRASPPQRPTYGFFAAAPARGRCRWHRSQGLQLRNTRCRPVSRALMDDVLASVCHLAGRPLPRRLACGSLPASDSALEEQLREVLGVLEGGRMHRAKCLAVLAGVA